MAIIAFCLLFIAMIIFRAKWGNRYIIYRQKHMNAAESRKPITIVTSLTAQKSLELISELLPDHKNKSGAIYLLSAKGNRLDFGVNGSISMLADAVSAAINSKTFICRFSIVAVGYTENNVHKTAIRVATTKWVEKTGVFHDYKLLIAAQDKLTDIVKEADPAAQIFYGKAINYKASNVQIDSELANI